MTHQIVKNTLETIIYTYLVIAGGKVGLEESRWVLMNKRDKDNKYKKKALPYGDNHLTSKYFPFLLMLEVYRNKLEDCSIKFTCVVNCFKFGWQIYILQFKQTQIQRFPNLFSWQYNLTCDEYF